MCTCMFLTDKEAADERSVIRMNCATNGWPRPSGSYIARVHIDNPTNPETNGDWYATTRYDYHWALIEKPEHADLMELGNGDNFEDARKATANFVESLIIHDITAFTKVELLKLDPVCPLPEIVATLHRH